MSVRDSLVLDHFYIDVEGRDFDLLMPLTQILNKATYSKTDVQGDQWEGIYIFSRTRAYFEFLRARRPGGLGLCFSPISLVYTDASKIMAEMPEEKWNSGTRLWTNGRTWYEWISTGNYLDLESQFFNAWIMKYYPEHIDWSGKLLPATIDKFRRISLTLGRAHVGEVERLSRWFPGTRSFDEKQNQKQNQSQMNPNQNQISFQFQDRDAYPFHVSDDLVDGDQRFEFKELEMKFDPQNLARSIKRETKLGSFTLIVQGETLRLIKG